MFELLHAAVLTAVAWVFIGMVVVFLVFATEAIAAKFRPSYLEDMQKLGVGDFPEKEKSKSLLRPIMIMIIMWPRILIDLLRGFVKGRTFGEVFLEDSKKEKDAHSSLKTITVANAETLKAFRKERRQELLSLATSWSNRVFLRILLRKIRTYMPKDQYKWKQRNPAPSDKIFFFLSRTLSRGGESSETISHVVVVDTATNKAIAMRTTDYDKSFVFPLAYGMDIDFLQKLCEADEDWALISAVKVEPLHGYCLKMKERVEDSIKSRTKP